MQFLEQFRELAAKGEYEDSLESFKEFGDEIGEMEKDKTSMIEGYSWKQIKNELQKEAHLVNEILNELSFFTNAESFGQKTQNNNLDTANNKPQKSIQKRYEIHIGNKKQHKKEILRRNAMNNNNNNKKHDIPRNRQHAYDNKRKHIENRKREKCSRDNNKLGKNNYKGKAKDKDKDKYNAPSGIDYCLVEMIEESVIQRNIGISWDDIVSLDDVKKTLKEVIILPHIIPEYFKGIRKPFGGILLFGAPGTGKTMLAKAVASTAKSTFFNVSPSLIISKWRGDSPKLIRILFEMARYYAPSVIFFDEIDAIASSRSMNNSNNHDSSRQLKSELLIQMDGVINGENEGNVIVLAATNYPWLLDEALRRRLEKRIYIDLPDYNSRISLFKKYFKDLDLEDDIKFNKLSEITQGYNASDIQIICRNASMIPIRKKLQNIDVNDLENLKTSDIDTKITHDDIENVILKIKSSVSKQDVDKHKQWFHQFGSL